MNCGHGGHTVEQQRQYPVRYRGRLIGTLIPDLIVNGVVIVDPKVATAFNDTHFAQMLGYLNITGLQVALPIALIVAIVLAVTTVSNLTSDGECHGMEGVMLMAVYLMLAIGFFFLPV